MTRARAGAPVPFADRQFALSPKRNGRGYEVVEVVPRDDAADDGQVRIRRWDSADKRFADRSCLVPRAQIVGEVPAGDRRLADIARFLAAMAPA